MIRDIFSAMLLLIFLLCVASPVLRADVDPVRLPYTQVCVNSDGDETCGNQTIIERKISAYDPINLSIAYIESVSGSSFMLKDPITMVLNKSLPRDISPLTFLHTVRILSSFPAAQSGTANSPYAAYRAYTVGAARRDYSVNITLSENSVVTASFSVNEQNPRYLFKDDSYPFLVNILDEQSAPLKDDTPAGGILFVPVKQDGSLEPVYEGLLLPQAVAAEIIDARQLNQLRDADLEQVAANPNAETVYLVRNQLAFKNALAEMSSSLMLVRHVRDHAYSTVRLLLKRAQVDIIEFEAVGWLNGASIAPFEAMSRNGRLRVSVQNVGAVRAGYLVSVRDCSSFVGIPIVSRFVELAANTQEVFEIELPLSGDTDSPQVCHVVLQSPTGRVFDDCEVYFDPTSSSAAGRLLF